MPNIFCGCLPGRIVDARHFHVAFAGTCISLAEIRTAWCARSSDDLAIQHVFWDATVSQSPKAGDTLQYLCVGILVSPGYVKSAS